ncbi:MAG: NAD(+)/NADH kinase [Spirochaetales bacterium]|nr:NAD(+)/NADH kinase [Spirochaetales bacterium]
MERSIKKVLIVVNLNKPKAEELVSEISTYLLSLDIQVKVFRLSGRVEPPVVDNVDLVFSLGGDGTVLFCSRILQDRGIPILAVNLGTFGFITEVSIDEWKEAFDQYVTGKTGLSHRLMIRVAVTRNGETIFMSRGLNDLVVKANGVSNIVNLKLDLNETRLGTFRADGILVATPTGSTAYSLAAGGPILDSEMDALIVTPICPFTLSNRPIVVSGEDVIHIEVLKHQRTDINLSIDGQEMLPLREGDVVIVERSRGRALLVLSNKRNFYEVVRAKLNWSGASDA